METSVALTLIKALADGLNPHTAQTLPSDNLYQDGQAIRALHVAVRVLSREVELERKRKGLPAKTGQSWTPAEEQDLATRFDAGISIADLAREFERTSGAVQARLAKLGKIELDQYPSWGRKAA
jgi:hypothetical protein